MNTQGTVAFLAGSPERLRLLSLLRESPGSPRDIADSLDVSHRSAQRNLSEFADRGWVRKRDGNYTLTPSGELVTRTHANYVETLETIERFDAFLRHLPDAPRLPDPTWLHDATLVVASADQPQAPVSEYVNRLRSRETDTIRMLAPVLSRLYHDVHAELVFDGVETELVMPADTLETARSLNPLEFGLVTRTIDIYRYDGSARIGVTLGDDWALAGAYDEDGQLRALVDCDRPAFVEWAEEIYHRYREAARPVR